VAGGDQVNDLDRNARATLTYLVEPGDRVLGALLSTHSPAEILTAIKDGTPPLVTSGVASGMLTRAFERWRLRLPELPSGQDLAGQDLVGRACRNGIRLVCPGDPEWPVSLDGLYDARPYALWVRGTGDLRFGCLRSVSIVGSRAATGYGAHVAGEMAADLAERGWLIVSGGAYGIDAAAHRGALLTSGATIAVLACGVDRPYPAGHDSLFAGIADGGLLVSEWPPGSRPTRFRFLVRNRVIAALTRGTVVVEAGERSGALNTARHAAELVRPLMAVPGPVTSAQSAGCHRIIRDWGGVLVTGAGDVLDLIAPMSEPARAELDPDTERVLDAFPARAGAGTSTLARKADADVDTVLRCLGRLAANGLIERCAQGWRRTGTGTLGK
jgi:DNA processing protein